MNRLSEIGAPSFQNELSEMGRAWNLDEETIRVLAYRPDRRLTFRAGRPDADNSGLFKIMPEKYAARLVLVLAHLEEESQEGGWLFPRLVLWSGRWLELEFREGRSLFESMDRIPELSGRLASLLATLHATAPPPLRTHDVFDECEVVRGMARCAEERDPNIAAAIRSLLDELERPDDLAGRAGHVFLHRDFYDKQILLSDDGFVLIDWDCAAIGPPAIDVGNFTAHVILRHLQGRMSASAARLARARFLEHYLAASGEIAICDIKYFESLSILRLAGVYASRANGCEVAGKLLEKIGRRVRA